MTRPSSREGEGLEHSEQDVRQGDIILRTRRRRVTFIGGLVGIVILTLLVSAVA